MNLAPDEYTGFTMTLLRMAAFRPLVNEEDFSQEESQSNLKEKGSQSLQHKSLTQQTSAKEHSQAMSDAALKTSRQNISSVHTTQDAKDARDISMHHAVSPINSAQEAASIFQEKIQEKNQEKTQEKFQQKNSAAVLDHAEHTHVEVQNQNSGEALAISDWPSFAAQLPLRGLSQQLAHQSELLRIENHTLHLRVSLKQLAEKLATEKLKDALSKHFGFAVSLQVEVGTTQVTVAAAEAQKNVQKQEEAVADIHNDVFVKALVNTFDAQIESIKAL